MARALPPYLSYLLLLLSPLAAVAQAQPQVYLTPLLGTHIAAADMNGLEAEAEDVAASGLRPLVVGVNIEAGPAFRWSVVYVADARARPGVEGLTAGGSVLGIAADVVARPIPRVLFQPYLVGGAAYKRRTFSEEGHAAHPALENVYDDFAFHVGAGADLALGRGLYVALEATDFITSGDVDELGRHDVFVTAGLRVRVQ